MQDLPCIEKWFWPEMKDDDKSDEDNEDTLEETDDEPEVCNVDILITALCLEFTMTSSFH